VPADELLEVGGWHVLFEVVVVEERQRGFGAGVVHLEEILQKLARAWPVGERSRAPPLAQEIKQQVRGPLGTPAFRRPVRR